MPGFRNYGALMKKPGKHKHSVSCLNLNRLSNIDKGILTAQIERSVTKMKKNYTTTL